MKKVANSEILVNARNALIENVKSALDLSEIKRILEEQHNLEITDELEVNSGEMIIHDNKIAFRMEFEVLLSLSVLLDSNGNFISPEETPEYSIEEMGSEAEDIMKGM